MAQLDSIDVLDFKAEGVKPFCLSNVNTSWTIAKLLERVNDENNLDIKLRTHEIRFLMFLQKTCNFCVH